MSATVTQTMTVDKSAPTYENVVGNGSSPAYKEKPHPELLYDKNAFELQEVSKQYDNTPDDISNEDAPRSCVRKFQVYSARFCRENSTIIVRLVLLALLVLYAVYFAFALRTKIDGPAHALIACTCTVVFLIVYAFIRDHFGGYIWQNCLGPVCKFLSDVWPYTRW